MCFERLICGIVAVHRGQNQAHAVTRRGNAIMYARQPNKFPGWLVVLAAMLLVFGGYYLWQGFMAFMATNGNIAAPATATAFRTFLEQTITGNTPGGTLDLGAGMPITLTAPKTCQHFKVK